MSQFFSLFGWLCNLCFLLTLVSGYFQLSAVSHVLLGLFNGVLNVSLHCLVFGIFTGAGKDARELVQDLKLDARYIELTKSFRKKTFPAALYCIFLIMATILIGGTIVKYPLLRWGHLTLAILTFLYNFKTIRMESASVKENAAILKELNLKASNRLETNPENKKEIPEIAGYVNAATETLDWNSHVHALGKFLCFLGWNIWLPYIYLRFVMGHYWVSVIPFGVSSLFLFGFGYYLRLRYHPAK